MVMVLWPCFENSIGSSGPATKEGLKMSSTRSPTVIFPISSNSPSTMVACFSSAMRTQGEWPFSETSLYHLERNLFFCNKFRFLEQRCAFRQIREFCLALHLVKCGRRRRQINLK